MPRIRHFGPWAAWAKDQIYEDRPEVIAVDTETTGLDFYDEPFCATVSWRDYGGEIRNAYITLEGNEAEAGREYLTGILRLAPTWVLHNAKFDLQKLILVGVLDRAEIDEHRIEDTVIIYALIDENDRKGLKYLAKKFLGEETDEEEKLKVVRRKLKLKKSDGYHYIPRPVLVPYALKDTEYTLRLYERLRPLLPADVEDAYRREMDLVKVLLDMEAAGIALDDEYLDDITSEYGAKVMEAGLRIADLADNPDINPNAPAQLVTAFATRGIHVASTDEAHLSALKDELAEAVLEYRGVKKVHTTYLTAMQRERRNGLLHPNFNSVAARTGRMSSSSATG